ncbi:WXG100 family type VII secretion target [Nocardia sp. NBC_01388]|uniref:WXG100 family type VII secretion target n=1 Tax=Nocardia sp. NBC_01388 TaxID=2903596 RepID=UPI003244C507
MKYDPAILTQLSQDLDTLHKQLTQQASTLQSAAKTLSVAWEGNEGYSAFAATKSKWDGEFGSEEDTSPQTAIGKLKYMSTAVANALTNAQNADGGVAGAFGGGRV